MSIASLGIVGGLSGTALPQRAADVERTTRETTDLKRAIESAQGAEDAAGIGKTEEDSQTSDRDADGRRLWEQPEQAKKQQPAASSSDITPVLSKDPSGSCGGLLDLVG